MKKHPPGSALPTGGLYYFNVYLRVSFSVLLEDTPEGTLAYPPLFDTMQRTFAQRCNLRNRGTGCAFPVLLNFRKAAQKQFAIKNIAYTMLVYYNELILFALR